MLRYFRETKVNYYPNTQWVWDTNIKRGVWLYFDGRFKDHSTYDLATFINDVREGSWIETSEHGIITSTPEIVAEQKEKEEREERKAKEAEQARMRAEIAQREKERQEAESRRLATLNHRNKVNDTLGINIFGRLAVIEGALESRSWTKVRGEIAQLLTFIPDPPTFTYYKNTTTSSYDFIKGWRKNNVTGVFESLNKHGTWSKSGWSSPESLSTDSHYTCVEVATEADLLTPAKPYLYWKIRESGGWCIMAFRYNNASGEFESYGRVGRRWLKSSNQTLDGIQRHYGDDLVSVSYDPIEETQ